MPALRPLGGGGARSSCAARQQRGSLLAHLGEIGGLFGVVGETGGMHDDARLVLAGDLVVAQRREASAPSRTVSPWIAWIAVYGSLTAGDSTIATVTASCG